MKVARVKRPIFNFMRQNMGLEKVRIVLSATRSGRVFTRKLILQ